MIPQFSNTGYKKIVSSQHNGMLLDENAGCSLDRRQKKESIQTTKSFTETSVLRHQSTAIVTMSDLHFQKDPK